MATRRRGTILLSVVQLIMKAAYWAVWAVLLWAVTSVGLGVYKKVTGQCGETWQWEPVLMSNQVCAWVGEFENAPDVPKDDKFGKNLPSVPAPTPDN